MPEDLIVPTLAEVPRLALRRPDAAKALGISERQLQDMPEVPSVRLSERIVVYPVDSLRAWLIEQAAGDEGGE